MPTMVCSLKDAHRHVHAISSLLMMFVVVCGFTSSAVAQQERFKDLFEGSLAPKPVPKAEFTLTLSPSDAKQGDPVIVTVSAKLPRESYIYATTGEFDARTRIKVTNSVGLDASDEDFLPDRAPETMLDPVFKEQVSKFHGDVTWSKKFRISKDADLSKVVIDLELEGQYCSEGPGGQCTRIHPPLQLHAALALPSVPFQFAVRPKRGKESPVETRFQLGPSKKSAGKTVKLTITMLIDKDWHTFSSTFKGEGGTPTEITLDKVYGLKAIGKEFVANPPPEIKNIPALKLQQEIHEKKVTWTQEFEVLPDARAFGYGVEGLVAYQVCNEGQCLPPRKEKFVLGVTSDDVEAPANVPSIDDTEPQSVSHNRPQDKGLFIFILTAIGAGIVALLTPCVFPMVPITVSFFLKQNEAKGGRPIVLALVFSTAIVASFVVIGVGIAAIFGATKPNELANNWVLNLFLAVIFFAFALNMLGLFEIQVPSWLLSMTSTGEQTGGFVGVIFMALTFVLTSFSCTFAFVGSLLAAAAQGEYYWPVLGMLAFGATFAAPFFVLALMPGFLKSLPKSGGWLNSVKVVMGFVEAGVAVKYISIVDQIWNSVPWLFDFTNVMTFWAVLAICTGLYLLGQFRLSHDAPVQGLSPLRVLWAMAFLILGGLFVVGLTNPDRESWVMDQLVAFAPARLDNEEFELDLDRGIADATRKNQPLFIDFTGVNCVNCRLMEKRMAKPHNHRRLERLILVQLYTDTVPKIADANERKRILENNVKLQESWFGDVTLPAYAVVTPDGKTILAQYKGLEARTGDFAKFLDEGWDRWQSLQSQNLSRLDGEPIR